MRYFHSPTHIFFPPVKAGGEIYVVRRGAKKMEIVFGFHKLQNENSRLLEGDAQ